MGLTPTNAYFASQFRYERVVLKGHVSFVVGAFGFTTFTINHNLGYIPFYRSWYTYDNQKFFQLFAGNTSYGIGGNGGQIEDTHPTSTQVMWSISENNGAPISGLIYYRIYAEPQT